MFEKIRVKEEENSNYEKELARGKEHKDVLKEAQRKHEDAKKAHATEIEEIKKV